MAKRKTKRPHDEVRYRGDHEFGDTPVWGPLEALVGLHLAGHFMWMGTVQLVDGPELQVYKHRWTRRSVHVAPDNSCFYFDWDGTTIPEPDTPSEFVQGSRFSLLLAIFDWSNREHRWWSDELTERLIQDALRNAMDGKAYLVHPHKFDQGPTWDELDDDWRPTREVA